jgi:UrcA family protein
MTMKTTKTSTQSRIAVRAPLLATLGTICLAIASTAVRAADMPVDPASVTKTVTYGDLNLGNPQGVEQLYRRIVGAAQQVCAPDGRSLAEKQQFSICTKQSIARAVAAIDQPALSTLQAIKTGQPDTAAKFAKR